MFVESVGCCLCWLKRTSKCGIDNPRSISATHPRPCTGTVNVRVVPCSGSRRGVFVSEFGFVSVNTEKAKCGGISCKTRLPVLVRAGKLFRADVTLIAAHTFGSNRLDHASPYGAEGGVQTYDTISLVPKVALLTPKHTLILTSTG